MSKKQNKKKLFVISNSETSRELPFPDREYLSPYPTEKSKTYVWNKGLVGSAGFYYDDAKHISERCHPKGDMISMDTISKNIVKE